VLAIWECCAYLVSDERRAAVFRRLKSEVGLSPRAIRSRPLAQLAAVIQDGGMLPRARAEKVHAAADVALDVGLANLRRLVKQSPRDARKMLRRFPGIGEPGADKILLFCHGDRSLAPDSNALRVLIRLGYGRGSANYSRQYRSAALAVAPELPAGFDWLIAAHQLLRRHGQMVCTRSSPRCDVCPLRDDCAWYLARS
jgi:endonuclease III